MGAKENYQRTPERLAGLHDDVILGLSIRSRPDCAVGDDVAVTPFGVARVHSWHDLTSLASSVDPGPRFWTAEELPVARFGRSLE